MTDLSVVVPVFNEEDSIESIVLGIESAILPLAPGAEVIVVDDCSTDGTPGILDLLAANRPWLQVEHASCNAGHGPSVVRGLELARGEWIFQIDSDGQFVLDEFSLLWERRQDADVVLGVRVRRRDPLHRLVLSRVIGLAVWALAGRRLRDPNVPFRLLRRELWEELRPAVGAAALAPSILVAVGAALRGRRIVEVPVTHLPRLRGRSSLRTFRLLAFSLRGLGQLLRFVREVRRPAAVGRAEETAA